MPQWLSSILAFMQEHNYATGIIGAVVIFVMMKFNLAPKLLDSIKSLPNLFKGKSVPTIPGEDDEIPGVTEIDLVNDPQQLLFYYYQSLRDAAEYEKNEKALKTLDQLLVDLFTFSPPEKADLQPVTVPPGTVVMQGGKIVGVAAEGVK